MISIVKGTIISKNIDTVIVENNGLGYEIGVSNSENFTIGEEYTLLTYLHVREDEISLYGFSNKEEKNIFMSLISVKGIGVKSAMQALSKTSSNKIYEAIEKEDIAYLKKLPKIGPKAAQQIVLDLKGKLDFGKVNQAEKINNPLFEEAKSGLKALGFKAQEIDLALSKIRSQDDLTVDQYILKALQFLNKK